MRLSDYASRGAPIAGDRVVVAEVAGVAAKPSAARVASNRGTQPMPIG